MVRVEDGLVTIRPLAGTRPPRTRRRRGPTPGGGITRRPERTCRTRDAHRSVRNDVGRVAQFGSIELSDVMVVERYSHVMHITSSDGGGSVRVPAHFCGICGLKPTPGRIPATGHYPECAGPFALIGVVGPMARTVADLKVLFEVMQGQDSGDACAAPVPLRWPSEAETRRLRVGYFEDDGRTPVTPETRAAVRTAAEALRSAGFEVEPFHPEGLEEARQLWHQLFVVAGGMLLRPMFKGRESDLSPILKQFLEWSAAEPALTGETLLQVWIERD